MLLESKHALSNEDSKFKWLGGLGLRVLPPKQGAVGANGGRHTRVATGAD